jgi:hypothetical protein
MRCFYVLVHGSLEWPSECSEDEDLFTPAGFYCHRYVLAAGYKEAAEKAFHRVRSSLEKQTGWLSRGPARLTLEAAELAPAPLSKLLKRGNRGQSFYEGENIAPVGAEMSAQARKA